MSVFNKCLTILSTKVYSVLNTEKKYRKTTEGFRCSESSLYLLDRHNRWTNTFCFPKEKKEKKNPIGQTF